LLPVLEGKSALAARTLFWRIATTQRQQRAVRSGDWKLLVDGDDQLLFDLRSDIAERRDLAGERQDLVRRLSQLLSAWETSVDAESAARR
jgi:hypothetical protein